jgi:hypothetical protein
MRYTRSRTGTSVALAVTLAAAVTTVMVLRSPHRADAATVGTLVEVHQGDNGDLVYHNVGENLDSSPPTFSSPIMALAGGGFRPTVAANGGVVVEAHQRGTGVGELTAMVGLYRESSDGAVTWFSDETFASGANPSIAMNDNGTVVVCYDNGSNQVYYRVGIVAGGHVDWAPQRALENAVGTTASVALNENGQVFVAYTGARGLGHFTGRLSGNTLVKTGSISGTVNMNGTVGSVAVMKNTVVEVGAQSDNHLWYRVGTFSSGAVNFVSEGFYDWGLNPSIAIEPKTRKVVELHEGGGADLWTHPGALTTDSTNINWGSQWQYDWGLKPVIAG